MQDEREKGYGADQFTSWIRTATPEEAMTVTKLGLGRVGQLGQEHRDRFVDDVGKDPAIARLFEEIRTPA